MSYNTDLQNNNTILQSLLEVAQVLPDKGIVHSTEEVLTGSTWLNGKPIYAKTFVHTNAAGNTAHSLNLPENIELAWLDSSNTFHVNLNGVIYSLYSIINDVNYFNCFINTESVIYKTGATTGGDFYIRVFYTKTTD